MLPLQRGTEAQEQQLEARNLQVTLQQISSALVALQAGAVQSAATQEANRKSLLDIHAQMACHTNQIQELYGNQADVEMEEEQPEQPASPPPATTALGPAALTYAQEVQKRAERDSIREEILEEIRLGNQAAQAAATKQHTDGLVQRIHAAGAALAAAQAAATQAGLPPELQPNPTFDATGHYYTNPQVGTSKGGGKAKLAFPAKFSGDDALDVDDALYSFENYLRGSNIPEEQWAVHAAPFLLGSAAKQYITHARTTHSITPTWAAFKEVLLRFRKPNKQLAARQQLAGLSQGTRSVQMYIQQYKMLTAQAGPSTSADDVFRFWSGLRDKALLAVNPLTSLFWTEVEPLMQYALNTELTRAVPPQLPHATPANNRHHKTSTKPWTAKFKSAQVQGGSGYGGGRGGGRGGRSNGGRGAAAAGRGGFPSPQGGVNKTRRCFICMNWGVTDPAALAHSLSACPRSRPPVNP
jgi:uncharacterized membrane protein YgcG